MYRIAVAAFFFVSLVCFGVGSNVYAQLTNCPDVRGTWDFQQTYIQICYTTPPQLTVPPTPSYSPGTIQGQEYPGYEESGVPTYVTKTGTYTIYQYQNPDTSEFSCFIHAKRVHNHTKNSAYIVNEYDVNPPREDWYSGVIHGAGTRLTMRAIPSESSPAGRWEGELIKNKRTREVTEICYVADTDLPAPLCYPILNTGATAGGGHLYNRH